MVKESISWQLEIFHQLVTYTLQTVHTQLSKCESEEVLEYLANPYRTCLCSWALQGYLCFYGTVYCTWMQWQYRCLLQNAQLRVVSCTTVLLTPELPVASATILTVVIGTAQTIPSISDKYSFLLVLQNHTHLYVRLNPLDTTMMNQAGHPCRTSHLHYQEADLLSMYIVPVDISTELSPLRAVSVNNIMSKLVLVSVSDRHYCVVQPNRIETLMKSLFSDMDIFVITVIKATMLFICTYLWCLYMHAVIMMKCRSREFACKTTLSILCMFTHSKILSRLSKWVHACLDLNKILPRLWQDYSY